MYKPYSSFGFLAITLFLLLVQTCKGLRQIWAYTLLNVSNSQIITFQVPSDIQTERMFVEATSSSQSLQLNSIQEFLMLVASPQYLLPNITYLQEHENEIEDLLEDQIYFDEEGYGALRDYQFVSTGSAKQGQWKIGLYYLRANSSDIFNIKIRVFSIEIDSNFYPEGCNAVKTDGKNSCINQNNIINSRLCQCGKGYIGLTCFFEAPMNLFDQSINVIIQPLSWEMISFNGSNFSSPHLQLFLQGKISHSRLSIVYGAASNNSVPYFTKNSYEILQESSFPDWQEFPIIDAQMQKVYNQTFLDQQASLFPFKDRDYDQVLILGFYNESPISTVSFSIKVKIADDVQNYDYSYTIIFIVTGCVVLFCSVPISFLCLRKYRLSERLKLQLLQNSQNRNNVNPSDQSNQNQHGPPISQSGIEEALPSSIRNNFPISSNDQSLIQQVNLLQDKKVVPITSDTVQKFMPLQMYEEILKLYPKLKDECSDCIVCLEGFKEKIECRLTPCFHLFHSECLLSWFKKHSTCPYCRASCNRKGIIEQLHQFQKNVYVKRFAIGSHQENNSKQHFNENISSKRESKSSEKISLSERRLSNQDEERKSSDKINNIPNAIKDKMSLGSISNHNSILLSSKEQVQNYENFQDLNILSNKRYLHQQQDSSIVQQQSPDQNDKFFDSKTKPTVEELVTKDFLISQSSPNNNLNLIKSSQSSNGFLRQLSTNINFDKYDRDEIPEENPSSQSYDIKKQNFQVLKDNLNFGIDPNTLMSAQLKISQLSSKNHSSNSLIPIKTLQNHHRKDYFSNKQSSLPQKKIIQFNDNITKESLYTPKPINSFHPPMEEGNPDEQNDFILSKDEIKEEVVNNNQYQEYEKDNLRNQPEKGNKKINLLKKGSQKESEINIQRDS